ncbi:hypothetical protein HUU39_23505 [candidate division KSB1 bacterium]|nr:hypothetical protein [bacterium]NUM68200.1 hypothetical protein [candidate division KSB1 bacterium]
MVLLVGAGGQFCRACCGVAGCAASVECGSWQTLRQPRQLAWCCRLLLLAANRPQLWADFTAIAGPGLGLLRACDVASAHHLRLSRNIVQSWNAPSGKLNCCENVTRILARDSIYSFTGETQTFASPFLLRAASPGRIRNRSVFSNNSHFPNTFNVKESPPWPTPKILSRPPKSPAALTWKPNRYAM